MNAETAPLLSAKRDTKRPAGGTRLLFATSAILVCVTLCVIPLIVASLTSPDRNGKKHNSSSPSRSQFCVAHAAYGTEFRSIAEVSAVTKRRYAEMHGYQFLEYISDSLDEFVDTNCPELRGQIDLAYSKTTPVKSCGMWAALRDSCDYVLWTDADAVLVDSSLTMEALLYLEPSQGVSTEDVERLGGKDVLFFLEAYKELGLCPELNDDPAPGFCGSADSFGNCVNTGALILRKSDFAETMIRNQLALAIFDNDFLLDSPCSTQNLGVGASRNITWDQCMFVGETEQCTLSCMYRNEPQLLDNTMCRVSDDNQTHYLFGTLLDPPEEALESLLEYAAAHNIQLPNTTTPTDMFEGAAAPHRKPPRPYQGSLVYNCMGGDYEEKLQCVTYATYYMWPEMNTLPIQEQQRLKDPGLLASPRISGAADAAAGARRASSRRGAASSGDQ